MARLRRDHQALDDVGARRKLQLAVEHLLAVDRQAIAPDPGGARSCTRPGSVARITVCTSMRSTGHACKRRSGCQVNAQPRRCSLPSTVPSPARKRTSTPLGAVRSPNPRSARHRDAAAGPHARRCGRPRRPARAPLADPAEATRRRPGRPSRFRHPWSGPRRRSGRRRRGASPPRRSSGSSRALVAGQHEAGRGRARAACAATSGVVKAPGGRRRWSIQRPDSGGEAQQPHDLVVDRRPLDARRRERHATSASPQGPVGPGIDEVERRVGGCRRSTGSRTSPT